MISQDEVVVRLGLDARDFERRLREADTIARKYANRTGAALNTGSPDGSIPQSWQGIANLSRNSQMFLRQGDGLRGLFNSLKDSIGAVNPPLAGVAGRILNLTSRLGPLGVAASAAFSLIKGGADTIKRAFQDVKEASNLDVSVSFLRELRMAADRSAESIEDAKGGILKFQQVLAAAAEGNKDALASLGRVGIKDPTGKTMEENLRDVAKGFAHITDAAQKAKAAVDLFGKGSQTFMPDILGSIKPNDGRSASELSARGADLQTNRDTATIAEGWKAGKRIWQDTVGAAVNNGRRLSEFYMAGSLRNVGVDAAPAQPSKLEKTESPEVQAQNEARAKKYAEDLAKAKNEYAHAVRQSYDSETQLRQTGYDLINIAVRLRDDKLDELDRTKLLTEQAQKQSEFAKLQADQSERRKQIEQQVLSLKKAQNNLKQAQDDLATRKSDRTKWTVGDLANNSTNQPGYPSNDESDPRKWKTDRDGLPIIPDNVLRQQERGLKRRLSPQEIQSMRREAGSNIQLANSITDAEGAAHMNQLFGGNQADAWNDQALGWRKKLNPLTAGEKNPFDSQEKSISEMKDNIAAMAQAMLSQGIVVRPRMGK